MIRNLSSASDQAMERSSGYAKFSRQATQIVGGQRGSIYPMQQVFTSLSLVSDAQSNAGFKTFSLPREPYGGSFVKQRVQSPHGSITSILYTVDGGSVVVNAGMAETLSLKVAPDPFKEGYSARYSQKVQRTGSMHRERNPSISIDISTEEVPKQTSRHLSFVGEVYDKTFALAAPLVDEIFAHLLATYTRLNGASAEDVLASNAALTRSPHVEGASVSDGSVEPFYVGSISRSQTQSGPAGSHVAVCIEHPQPICLLLGVDDREESLVHSVL